MAALVDVVEVKVVGANPAPFTAGFQFEITFECLEELREDLEWKIVYVGSAGDESKDQTLEEVMVGPVPVGTSKFVLEAPAPAWDAIPQADRLGVTVLSISCAYDAQPFVSVGYYVNNEFYPEAGPAAGGAPAVPESPEELARAVADAARVFRNVCVDEPRVTRYTIKWQGKSEPPETTTVTPPSGADAADVQPAAAAEDDADEPEDDAAGDDDEEEEEDGEDDDEDDDDEDREIDLDGEEDDDDEEDDEERAAKRPKRDEDGGDDGDEGDDGDDGEDGDEGEEEPEEDLVEEDEEALADAADDDAEDGERPAADDAAAAAAEAP